MPILDRTAAELPVNSKLSNYSLQPSDVGTELQFSSASAVTASLPPVGDVDNGYNVVIRNIGAGTLTIDPDGSEQIDGETTLALATDDWHWIRSDATSWKTVASNSIEIADGSVTNAKLAADAVTSDKILDGTIATADIANLAITNGKLAAESVTAEKIAANAVGSSEIAAGAVDTSEIASNAVDGSKIAMGSDAQGDILYYDGTDYTRLAAGTSGQVLKTNGTGANPQWVDTSSSSGKVVQMVTSVDTNNTQTSNNIPLDDTIPTSSEGGALSNLDTTITPTNSTNRLLIFVDLFVWTNTSNDYGMVTLFQDSGSSALAASATRNGGGAHSLSMMHEMEAGTTSATTFKIRIGGENGGMSINGESSRKFGGVASSRVTIMEIEV